LKSRARCAAHRRPASRVRAAGGADLARSLDRARSAARRRPAQIHPDRPCGRPGTAGGRSTGQRPRVEGGQRLGRRLLRRGRGRAPSVDLAATIALEMLAVDSAAGIELMTMYPPEIRGVLRALIELAGNPDHMERMLAYMMRQSLMRAWGRVPARAPAYPRPHPHGHLVRGGQGLQPS
jgi:hypothetical protein